MSHIHPTSFIDDEVQIGEWTNIWHFCHIMSEVKIGSQCTLGQNVFVGKGVKIGNGCKIQNNVSVYEGVELEDDVFVGPSAVFTNVYNPRSELVKMDEMRKTLIQKGATLGANCTIVCGYTIGMYALIGAGSVVIDDVPDYAMVVGNPAIRKGWVCKCGERIQFNFDTACCEKCGSQYYKETANKVAERT